MSVNKSNYVNNPVHLQSCSNNAGYVEASRADSDNEREYGLEFDIRQVCSSCLIT